MLNDARQLHAADIIINSHYPFSPKLVELINKYQQEGLAKGVMIHKFYSMAINKNKETSVLSQIKVVEKGYPFYGTVELASGRDFSKMLKSGSIIVETGVLDRLEAGIGDRLQLGSTELTIVDTVIKEPDRPVSFFSFGPRIFVSGDNLNSLDLIKKGSRVHYNYLLKINNHALVDIMAKELSNVSSKSRENVKTFRTAESAIKRFFDNFLFFLNLIGIFTLLLAGIGIQTALHALLRDSDHTIAIMKSVGATSRYISTHFITMIMLLGSTGTLFGLILSYLLQLYLPALFAGILPAHVNLTISWGTVGEGLILGTIVVCLFSFLPLCRTQHIKPASIFRKELDTSPKGLPHYTIIAIIIFFFTGMTIWQLEDAKTGIYFVLALFTLITITTLITHLLLIMIRKNSPRPLAIRQAFRGLFRPKNATRAIIITLSASLAVIFSIYLLEQNLQETFIQSYPPDLPNAYFLDIQPSQQEAFAAIIKTQPQLYPVVKARLNSINNRPINTQQEKRRKRDNLAREFNLTYRNFLLEDEAIVAGKALFNYQDKTSQQNDEVPVSILDSVADLGDINLGDLLVFKIQGFPLKARVTSIRTRTESRVRPFFYFVFPPAPLKDAPQTIFSAVKIEMDHLKTVQNKLASQLPNISVIDITKTIKVLAQIMNKLSSIIQFFTSFSIIAGLLIIISSVYATRLARIREAVYFKILGAKASFVLKVFSYENIIVALISALLASLISHAGSWFICDQIFNISYRPFLGSTLIMIGSTIILVLVVGLGASVSILKQKPIGYLRAEGQE